MTLARLSCIPRAMVMAVAMSVALALSALPPASAQTPPAAVPETPPETAPAPADAPAPAAPVGPGPAGGTLSYEAWAVDAIRAENLIAAGTASSAFLSTLRGTLVGWRTQFLAAQDANAARISTIEAQINALGAPPAEGASEPEAIAERRSQLTLQLTQAQVPRVTATEAFNRANGLIAEIDTILAERQARALLERDPAPVNPLNWAPALTALGDVLRTIEREISTRIAATTADGRSFWERVPFAAAMLIVALALVTRSRLIVSRWTDRLQQQVGGRRGRIALAFLVSLLQVLLPISGLVLIGVALSTIEILGPVGSDLMAASIALLVTVFAALWLAGRLFPVNPALPAVLGAPQNLRNPLRRAVVTIGLFLGVGALAETLSTLDVVPLAARGVFVLPVYLGLSLGFYRLASLMRRVRRSDTAARASDTDDTSTESGFASRSAALVGQAVRLIAVIGPLMAAVGYLNLAEAVMIPTGRTLGILALILVLQAPIRDLYAAATRKTFEQASEALLPVLVNLLLVIGLAPLVALIWGVRPEQVSEIYDRLSAGLQLGDTRITPGVFLSVILVFMIGMFATRMLQGALRSTVLPRTKLDVGARNAVTSGIGYVGIALAAVIAITTAGIDLTALGVVLGALSVGIGFGLQNVVNNFVSGIILLIERPISEGDWIEVGPTMGIVKAISVRSTTIETFDKTDVIVPNADLIAGTVTNWTRGNTIGRVIVKVGVAYGTDTRHVQKVLLEIAKAHPDVTKYPEPGVDFLAFGADSLDFQVRMILRDINKLGLVRTEVHHQIAERFKAEGIEIPFGQRDIWLRNPEALRPLAAAADPSATANSLPPTPTSPPADAGTQTPTGTRTGAPSGPPTGPPTGPAKDLSA